MFGYIIPDKPELKIKEFDLFKAYYCGICKCIAASYGHLPRFALSYDCTFLGLFLSSIATVQTGLELKSCITKPLKKIPVASKDDAIAYAAGMNILLAYHNLLDDIYDRSLRAYPALPIFYPAYRRARRSFAGQDKSIRSHLSELRELEGENCDSIDMVAQPFSNLLASVVSGGKTKGASKHIWELGYNVGKWLYIIDALDDLHKDMKSKNYNPIVAQFLPGYSNISDGLHGARMDEIKDYVGFILYYSLKQTCISYEALDIKRNKPILDNIIYGG
ncbi:MAG TPA: DUF5685 family protein, partial [Bacillota bacterium]|nr:DUF5685 family protein [Bacillota bacterium]